VLSKDLGLMYKWFHDHGYGADVEEVRRMKPDLKDFATWLERRVSSDRGRQSSYRNRFHVTG